MFTCFGVTSFHLAEESVASADRFLGWENEETAATVPIPSASPRWGSLEQEISRVNFLFPAAMCQ